MGGQRCKTQPGRRAIEDRRREEAPYTMKNLKMFETTIREPGPGGEEKTVRVMAESAQQARELLQQLHGVRSVPYMPRMVPH